MPIRASQRWFYPIDWPQLSQRIRFDRARGRCERCRRPHGEFVWHLSRTEIAGRRGLWWDDATDAWRCERGKRLPQDQLPSAETLALREVQLAFWSGLERSLWPQRSLVVLACCHLDHDPTNNRGSNLAALCQHCHLEHDRADNLARRRANARSQVCRETSSLELLSPA